MAQIKSAPGSSTAAVDRQQNGPPRNSAYPNLAGDFPDFGGGKPTKADGKSTPHKHLIAELKKRRF